MVVAYIPQWLNVDYLAKGFSCDERGCGGTALPYPHRATTVKVYAMIRFTIGYWPLHGCYYV